MQLIDNKYFILIKGVILTLVVLYLQKYKSFKQCPSKIFFYYFF